ncbi:glycosyltransferase family 39 protein [Candidatus Gottesmanbacteria bacterium]|nr:glycosyltransferase family 39 protein [Candidatus Gottesmanbacteria bacterium]
MRITLLFIVTIILGAALRFWWIAYDLPYAFNIDEAYIMDGAVDVADGNLRHGVIFRGSLPYYVTGLTIRLASMVYSTIKQGFPTFREAYAYDKTPFYIVGRAIVASYSMLTMIVLFLIARALFSETIGLLTILIFSLNTLEIQYAHQIYSDTALSFFMLLTLYTLVIAYKHKRQSLFLVSAVIIGLAMGQKLPGSPELPIYIW